MTVPRLAVCFSENALEPAIPQVAALAHGADNHTTIGLAFKALFPNGPSQVVAAGAVCERLASQPAAAKVKVQVMDDLEKALAAFVSDGPHQLLATAGLK